MSWAGVVEPSKIKQGVFSISYYRPPPPPSFANTHPVSGVELGLRPGVGKDYPLVTIGTTSVDVINAAMKPQAENAVRLHGFQYQDAITEVVLETKT